jgi:toxin ParE1/3/4
MSHRLAPQAEADFDDIWFYVATKSSSMEIANRLVDSINDGVLLLASFPYIGRPREEDLGPGSRSLAVGEYVIVYCVEGEDVLILRIVHGRRNLEAMLGHW